MADSTSVDKAVAWYSENRAVYESLAIRVESIIKDVLEQKQISYHTIAHRAKSIEDYRKKALKTEYKNPQIEIMDMAGIRVITYLESEANKAAEIIKSVFVVIPEYSIDKTSELGVDRVGYRSIHYVCTLGGRCSFPEYKRFKGLLFEIQIRSILQHAWAEFEHDRNYKFKGVLPDNLKRRLAIVAGNLELIDWAFESISESIDEYTLEVKEKTSKGDLNTQITSASLAVYLGQAFSEALKSKLLSPDFVGYDALVIEELSAISINTLEELEEIIPDELQKKIIELKLRSNYVGLLRDVMVIYNAELYFKRAWKNDWNGVFDEEMPLFNYFNPEIKAIFEKYNIKIH